MKEEYLIQNGFRKTTIPHSESGNGYDYYFYEKDICDELTLHSIDNDQVVDDNWTLTCWEVPAIKINSKEHYEEFMNLMKTLICE